MPAALPRRRPGPAAAAVVLGLHLLALLAVLRLGTWGERGPLRREQPPLVLQWLRDAPRAAAPATPHPAAPRSAHFERQPRAAAAPPAMPQAITLPGPAASPVPAPPPAGAAGTAPAAPAAAAPAPALNLTLPRGAAAPWRTPPAPLDDPRANTPRATVESRLAAAMGGDGSWLEEAQNNDGDKTHIRYRRGNLCIDVYKARAAQLNPWNQSFSPTPAQATKAQPC